MSRFLALANLAYRFNLHMLRKPFRRDAAGKQRFLDNYRNDNLLPLTDDQRELLPLLHGCIACGLCDTVCDKLRIETRHLCSGPAELASSLSRSMPHFRLARSYLDELERCGDCRRCEAICPRGVPLRQMACFVAAIAHELEVQRRG